MRALRRLRRDRRGVSALEFAVIAPVMVTVMLAAFDFGNAAQQQIALQEAVRSGAAYAQYFPTDKVGIRGAVTGAMPDGWSLSDVPVVSCTCNGGAAFSCDNPPANCPPPLMLTISATMPYTPISALFPTLNGSSVITANYVVRVQ